VIQAAGLNRLPPRKLREEIKKITGVLGKRGRSEKKKAHESGSRPMHYSEGKETFGQRIWDPSF